MLEKVLDMTYWRYKRSRRKCWHCGGRVDKNLGKVNYGKAFDTANPKRYWHEFCYSIDQHVSTPKFAQSQSTKQER